MEKKNYYYHYLMLKVPKKREQTFWWQHALVATNTIETWQNHQKEVNSVGREASTFQKPFKWSMMVGGAEQKPNRQSQ